MESLRSSVAGTFRLHFRTRDGKTRRRHKIMGEITSRENSFLFFLAVILQFERGLMKRRWFSIKG